MISGGEYDCWGSGAVLGDRLSQEKKAETWSQHGHHASKFKAKLGIHSSNCCCCYNWVVVGWCETHLLSLITNLLYKFLITFSFILLNEQLTGINNIFCYSCPVEIIIEYTWSLKMKSPLCCWASWESTQNLRKRKKGHRKWKMQVSFG